MRLRSIARLVAASAILLAVAAPSAAASTAPVPTRLTVGPVPVSYPALQAAISGMLTTRTATPAPVPDATITLYFQSYTGSYTQIGTVSTDTAGSYALNATLPGPGGIWAVFNGSPGYAATTGSNLDTPAYLPTQITLHPLPSTVPACGVLQVTGTVQMQTPGGTWIPAPGAFVRVHGSTTNLTATAQANPGGQFTTEFTIVDPGPYEADVHAYPYSFAQSAQSAPDPVTIIPAKTRITGFTPSANPEIAQNGISFNSRADARLTTNGTTSWSGCPPLAQLWFRAAGTRTWTLAATRPVGYPDTAQFAQIPAYLPDGKLAEGSWQVRIPANAVFDASASTVINVPVKIQTWINHTRLKDNTLTAILDDQPTTSPLAGKTITLYYRTKHQQAWHSAGTATTSATGTFSLPLTRPRAWYKAVYYGTASYLGSATTPRYHN